MIYDYDELSIPWHYNHLLQTKDWEDRDGNKRYTTEIIAWRMQMLDRVGKTAEAEYPEERFPTEEPAEADVPEDDIPF
jgi:single-strand DNA-binding protein